MDLLGSTTRFIESQAIKGISKVGIFALAVSIIGYWISFEDRISNRQAGAWETLRSAIVWTQGNNQHWGNVGQLAAIETLTQSCSAWWRGTFVEPIFATIFSDCVDLNSVSLERMELGSLKGASGNFSQTNFACTNLARANFRKANLDGASFVGANMSGADVTGASLNGINFKLANVSWIQIDASDPNSLNSLKCACLKQDTGHDGLLYRQIQKSVPQPVSEILNRINICPEQRNTCEDGVQKSWKCID
jgi:hypothetical protein